MRVEVINTGTELVLGRTLNTHLSYLGEKLFLVGLRIQRQVCIPDGEIIGEELRASFSRADIVLVTGGLGPTSDDTTRETTAGLLRRPLVFDERVASHIKTYYSLRNRPFGEGGRRQSMVPEGATILWNDRGTAPGLYLAKTGEHPHVFLLPGPPREFYPMVEERVLPLLREIVDQPPAGSREWKFSGVGESELAEHLEPALSKIADLEIGYCAKPMEVHLRCLGPEESLRQAEAVVHTVYPHHLVSDDLRSQEEVVVQRLTELNQWVTVAESCTGGLISHRLTNVPGSSEVFAEGHVTYANAAKEKYLRVDGETLVREGAVSEAVARMMAEGALKQAGADHALAVTGIAGPGGGTVAKPAGTVYISLASRDEETHVEHDYFPTDRETFKWRVSQRALDLLRRRLFGYPLASSNSRGIRQS